MARIRSIKPSFFVNEALSDASRDARLLAIALLCIADREGRLIDSPKRIKLEAMPWDDVDVSALLDELVSVGFILRYEADGRRCIQVINFHKHQRPHVKEVASTIPAPTWVVSDPDPDGGQHVRDPGSGIRDLGSGDGGRAPAHEAPPTDPEDDDALDTEVEFPPSSESTARSEAGVATRAKAPAPAMAHIEAGPWKLTAEHLAVLDAAAEGAPCEPRSLPSRIGSLIGGRTRRQQNEAIAFDRWYALDADQVVAWCAEAMRLAKSAGNVDRSGWLNYAAAIAADKLELGVDLPANKVVPMRQRQELPPAAAVIPKPVAWW